MVGKNKKGELEVVVLQPVELSYIMAIHKDSHKICKLNCFLLFGKIII